MPVYAPHLPHYSQGGHLKARLFECVTAAFVCSNKLLFFLRSLSGCENNCLRIFSEDIKGHEMTRGEITQFSQKLTPPSPRSQVPTSQVHASAGGRQ